MAKFGQKSVAQRLREIEELVEKKGIEEAGKIAEERNLLPTASERKQAEKIQAQKAQTQTIQNVNNTKNLILPTAKKNNSYLQLTGSLQKKANDYVNSSKYAERKAKEEKEKLVKELKEKRYELEKEYKETTDWLSNVGGQGKYLAPEKYAENEQKAEALKKEIDLLSRDIDNHSDITIDNKIKYGTNLVAKSFVDGGERLADFLVGNVGTAVTTTQKALGADEQVIDKTRNAFETLVNVDVAGAGFDEVLERNARIAGIDQNAMSSKFAYGLGTNVFDLATSIGTGGASIYGSVGGGHLQESLQDGATLEQATIKADVVGAVIGKLEGALNKTFGVTGNSALSKVASKSKVVSKFVNDLSKTGAGKSALKFISEALEGTSEIGEEFAEEILDDVTTKIIYDKTREIGVTADEAKEIAIMTALTTFALRGVTGQSLTNTEINEAIEISKKYIDENKISTEKLPVAREESKNIAKQDEKIEENVSNIAQDAQVQQEITPNTNIAPYNNEKYVAEDIKAKMQQVVDSTNKVGKSDVKLEFTKLDGNIKAQTDGNTIKIDISKANLGDVIHEITHNTETSKGYLAVSDYILTELDKRGELQSIKDEMNTLYSSIYEQEGRTFTEKDLENEIVANYTEKFANDEAFVNKITQTDRNFAQKIYDWIKEKVNYYRTVSNMTDEQRVQYDELKRAEKLWMKALKENESSQLNSSKYSFAGQKGMNNAINNDYRNKNFEEMYNKALSMSKVGVNNETIRKTTNWYQDKNGDWKFEFSDKDMSLKNIKFEENKTYKLGDVLEHDTLFILYPELANYDVRFEHMNERKGGGFNKDKKQIRINSNKFNKPNWKLNIEGTLIHEIQHAIQNVENFEHGFSSKASRKAYYTSLGEIESTDAQRRFLAEKSGSIDTYNTPPESSKSNPKHKNYDNYMKNRNVIDKVKDSVYNFFNSKGKGNIYENIEEIMEQDNRKNNRLVDGGRRGRYVGNTLATAKNNKAPKYSLEDNARIDNSDKIKVGDVNEETRRKEYEKRAYTYISDRGGTLDSSRGMENVPRGMGKTVYRKFKKDFQTKGYIDINGREITNSIELADVAQVFRDPRYETFRMIYVKDNKVVGTEAISTKIPNTTLVFKTDSKGRILEEKQFYKTKNRMQRLGADGYYMVHNHPSGKAKASKPDIQSTIKFLNRLPGFKGHIIVNSGTYASIYKNSNNNLVWEDEVPIANYAPDDVDKLMNLDSEYNKKIGSVEELVSLADSIKNNPNHMSVIYADASNNIRLLEDVPNSLFNMSEQQIRGYLKNRAKENGASRVFVATNNKDVYDKASKYVVNKDLTDTVLIDSNNEEPLVKSARRELSTLVELNKKRDLFDDKIPKSFRVGENEEVVDSKGRHLTKEQQEYFKSSKIRDEKGNLLTVYHGSNSEFTIFDFKKTGQASKESKVGFWFTESDNGARKFASNLWYGDNKPTTYEVYLNLKNPKVYEPKDTSKEKIVLVKSIEDTKTKMKALKEKYEYADTTLQDVIRFNNYANAYGMTLEKFLEAKNVKKSEIPGLIESFNQYTELQNKIYKEENKLDNIGYDDSYEQFKTDLYSMVGQSARDANLGGIGMALNDYSAMEKLRNSLIEQGYDGIVIKNTRYDAETFGGNNNQYVAFNSNQIKNIANTTPTSNDDIRYSIKENEGKERKHYKSIATSEMVAKPGKEVAKNLLEKDRYIPTSNKKQLEYAEKRMKNSGIKTTLESFKEIINSGKRLTPDDLALGERLIQEYSNSQDIDTLNQLIQDVAIIGTELGQSVQALSLIHKMTPEGQLMTLQKYINRINTVENLDIKLTKEQTEKIVNAKGETELNKALVEVSEEIAEQLPIETADKLRSWRFLSMLGNPKTHIRNILSNVAMKGTMEVKNKIAGAIEDIVNPGERTRTLKRATRETKKFATKDAESMVDRIANGGKYDVNVLINQNKRYFDGRFLNIWAKGNSWLLDFEDKMFIKSAYKKALANYMTANELTPEYLQSGTKEANIALTKAREFASYEAQVATFRQFSWLATKINQVENKNTATKVLVGGLLPFKKTPINIAKTGIEYSPVGLAKTLTKNSIDLKKGNITANQYIDNISKGLTGTSISMIGYLLAQAGILKGSSGDDDREATYSSGAGNQEYAIKIGDKTFTIDWISPSAMPLLVGAEFYNSAKEDESTINATIGTMTKTLNPLVEMSMLQSFVSTLQSFSQGELDSLADMGMNMAESYAGQYVPTILGQTARVIDDTERNTYYTDKKDWEARMARFFNKQIAKIPFASKTLQPKVDVWGDEVKREDNIALRAINQYINPSYVKTIRNTVADKAVQKLYKASEDSSVLPKAFNSKFNMDSENRVLTPEENTKYAKKYGKAIKNNITQVANTREYNSLPTADRVKTIKAIYSDSNDKIKGIYADEHNIDYKATDDIDSAIKDGLSLSNAYIYRGNINSIQSEKDKSGETIAGSKSGNKAKYIMKLPTADEQKNLMLGLVSDSEIKPTVDALETIGENNYNTYFSISNSKTRAKYVGLAGTGMNSNSLNNYMDTISSLEADKDENGNSIRNSLKNKKYEYINSLNLTANEKKLLFAKDYEPSESDKAEIISYINGLNIDADDKYELLKQLKGVETDKYGNISW